MEPTFDAQTRALLASLDPDYDHESHIRSARTFAQMLGRAYVEHYGAPYDAESPMDHKLDGVFVGNTYHCKLVVFHGPVVYVDDPYLACASAMAAQNSMVRTMMPIFVKHKDYRDQREYRFVIPDKAEHEADSKIMPAPPLLLAAVGGAGDSKGPMLIPDFPHSQGRRLMRPKLSEFIPLMALVSAIALATAACGGNDGEETRAQETATPPPATDSGAPANETVPGDIEAAARMLLADELEADAGSFSPISSESVQLSDASLGCPQKSMM